MNRHVLGRLAVLLGFLVATAVARADLKGEMLALMDTLSTGSPKAEALVDWDHFKVSPNPPALQGKTVAQLYAGLPASEKKAFRLNFIRSFAQSFRQSSGGHRFADVPRVKGVTIRVVRSGTAGQMEIHKQGRAMKLGFVRTKGRLLLQSVALPSK